MFSEDLVDILIRTSGFSLIVNPLFNNELCIDLRILFLSISEISTLSIPDL